MFERIKKYYIKGLYNKKMVHDFVGKGKITEKQYEEIVGKD